MAAGSQWNPTQPLTDAEEEKEAQALAKRRARVDQLHAELIKAATPPEPKKKKGLLEW
jgi:hypothetical protein